MPPPPCVRLCHRVLFFLRDMQISTNLLTVRKRERAKQKVDKSRTLPASDLQRGNKTVALLMDEIYIKPYFNYKVGNSVGGALLK